MRSKTRHRGQVLSGDSQKGFKLVSTVILDDAGNKMCPLSSKEGGGMVRPIFFAAILRDQESELNSSFFSASHKNSRRTLF